MCRRSRDRRRPLEVGGIDDGWIVALEQRPPFLAHPDVLRDPTRRDVILMHERNEVRDLEAVHRGVTSNSSCLRADPLTPEPLVDMPSDLDLWNTLEVQRPDPAEAGEARTRQKLDEPKAESMLLIERAVSRIQADASSLVLGRG